MTSALTKHDTRLEKQAWNTLDNQGVCIVALEAGLAKVKHNQKTLTVRRILKLPNMHGRKFLQKMVVALKPSKERNINGVPNIKHGLFIY
jgi:hypothetical protein